MLYGITALGAVAGVVNVLVNSIAIIAPSLGSPFLRAAVMLLVYGSLVFINVRGVRGGAGAVTVVTLAKLVPLLLFIGAGIFFIHPANLSWPEWPGSKALGDSVILLIFAFVGIEVALIPSGEVKNPARTVPRSAYLALFVTTIIYITIQLVAQGTLGVDLANHSDAPLAEAAAKFLGNFGRTVLLAGATISAFGFVTSDILSSPRMIFAFGRDGALPAWFAHVHPRYRSPDVAIVTYAVLAFALSVTGTFEQLAVLSNVAVLLMYSLCCAACWFLVQRDVRADGQPFNFPGAKIVPAFAIVAIIWILKHATVREFAINAALLIFASAVYAVQRREYRRLLYAAAGACIGTVIAFLLRPSLMGKQASLDDILTALTSLISSKEMGIPLAQTSLNFVVAGLLIGGLVGVGLALVTKHLKTSAR